MPVYGTAAAGTAGLGTKVWDLEIPVAGTASLAVAMHRNPNLPNCIAAEYIFAASPGAFELWVEVADTDQDKFYVPKVKVKDTDVPAPLNASFVGRIEASNLVAKFVRLKMVARTNAVAITAKLS